MNDWRTISYGGLFCLPVLAILAMAGMDLIMLAATLIDWLVYD